MEIQKDEYIYDSENGYYVWYNSFREAINRIELLCHVDKEN